MTPLAVTLTPEEEAIKENLIKYEQLDDKIIELNSQIAALDIEIDSLNSTLDQNNKDIKDTEDKISTNKDLLEQTKKEIEESQKKLDIRIRSLYKSDFDSKLIIYILESKDFSDFFNRLDSMKKILTLDKKIIAEVEEKKSSLDTTIEELNLSAEKLENLKKSTETSLKTLEEKQQEQQNYLDQLNTEKNAVFATIEENEKKLISFQLSIVNSQSSTISELEAAINTLSSLISQLNSPYVINLAQDGINSGRLSIENKRVPVSRGTPTDNNNDSNNANSLAVFSMSSTAYTGGGTTATGLKPVRDANGISTIAVDSSVIPLGSKVYVSGYGVAIASDTGGAIRGNIVDVYFNSLQECISWGRRSVTVEILAYPGQW